MLYVLLIMICGLSWGYDFAFWLNFVCGMIFILQGNTIGKCVFAWLALLIFVT